MNEIRIDYSILEDDETTASKYASRTRAHVPRIGDDVRFNGAYFSVIAVLWVEDDEQDGIITPWVNVVIEPRK